jgi:hypothetical protein
VRPRWSEAGFSSNGHGEGGRGRTVFGADDILGQPSDGL